MLAELLLTAVTPASRTLRGMGLVTASVGLWSRGGRRKRQWEPHYARCHAAVRRAMTDLPQRRRVVVLGSGLARDVPLAELLAAFDEVVLVDAVHLPMVRLRHGFDRRIRFDTRDLSGMEGWLQGTATGREPPLRDLAAEAGIDLVISANLLSQIPIGLETFFETHPERAAALPDDMLALSVRGHLDDLASFACRVCLLTDTVMLEKDRAGALTDTLDLMHGVPLPVPSDQWDWTVAPFGEVDRKHEYVHRVHAYDDWVRASAAA